MNLLLPHVCKKAGLLVSPIGFAMWLSMQYGITTRVFTSIWGERATIDGIPPYHMANVVLAIVSFLSFLCGLYCIAFSKEKIEDEMIQKTRLDSFQFAAFVQILLIIVGFLIMIIYKEPGDGGLMLFFVSVLFMFWVSFIGRFNWILHVRLK